MTLPIGDPIPLRAKVGMSASFQPTARIRKRAVRRRNTAAPSAVTVGLMTTTPTAQGVPLDLSAGELRASADAVGDPEELSRRLADDGYLFLPGCLDRDEVLAARADILATMAGRGEIADGTRPGDAVPDPSVRHGMLLADVARASGPLQTLLYGGRMMRLYESLFGEAVRHFDYTWLRAVRPGGGTAAHMDSVFMNRGTSRLLTAWTPLGDIDRRLGGLAVLAASHRLEDVKNDYGSRDVDTYCLNTDQTAHDAAFDGLLWDGMLSHDPVSLGRQLGLRWLTTDYRAGDLLTFRIDTVHIGLDNNAETYRLSCDSRYQPASQPADERWIGPSPTGHGAASKHGLIC